MNSLGAIWVYQRPGDRFKSSPSDCSVKIASFSIEGHIAKLEVSFSSGLPSWPIAPGCIYRSDTLEVVSEIHRYEGLASKSIRAVTLDSQAIHLPAAPLHYRAYWTIEAGEAVLKGPSGWAFQTFSERQREHAHDIFDWTKIGTEGLERAWQFGSRDRWTTPANFERFILNDVLGWRSAPTFYRGSTSR